MLPMFFALDHFHYARWLPVFIDDLEALTVENPILFKEFQDGKFVVKSSIAPYSKIALDQKHEENNKTIKYGQHGRQRIFKKVGDFFS